MNGKQFSIARARRRREVFTLKQRGRPNAFTLAELLVSVFVLAIIILMMAQLMNNAAAITKTGHKHISTDTQARTIFDRMAVDIAQMLKRNDIDYYMKGPTGIYNGHGNGHGWGQRRQTGQQGSDQIAFFSQVSGYYPSTGSQSPISLVGYRVNENAGSPAYLKLERMGKGLLWNGVDNPNRQPNHSDFTSPIVFLPLLIRDRWPAAVSGTTADSQSHYETIGPGVFRFEYYYLLKNGKLTDVPWDIEARPSQTTFSNPQSIGLVDIEAIVVGIAVIDSASRALIDAANSNSLDDLASDMADFRTSPGRGIGGQKNIGDLEYRWNGVLVGDPDQGAPGVISTGQTSAGSPIPPEAAKAIRIYSKTFDLRTF
jgi:hypothetical protein